MIENEFRLQLNGKTAVFIDWANVYRWKDSLKQEVDLKRLWKYLRGYEQIKEIHFYFGTDVHPLSKEQIVSAKRIGYTVVTKPVKYVPQRTATGEIVWMRKCDFDLEIGLDCFEKIEKFSTFVFFSGDGDFATLYKRLIKKGKKVIVVFAQGHLGKEIRAIRRGLYLCAVKKFIANLAVSDKKISPDRRPGA